MLKYLSKIAMDMLPSVAATIIGAYIVNHYIITKPAADAPVAAAVSSAEPEKGRRRRSMPSRPRIRRSRQHPGPGGQGEGHFRKGHARANRRRKAGGGRKARRKAGRKIRRQPAETASIPVEPRHSSRLRAKRRSPRPLRRRRACSPRCAAPVVAAPNTAPPVEAAVAPESIATPTIWRARRSSACAVRRRFAACAGSRARPGCATGRLGARARCQRRRSGRFRRRSWSPRRRRDLRLRRRDRRGTPPYPAGAESTIRAARRRRPIFPEPPRRRSICVPRPWSTRRSGNTPRLPKTCCWRQNRCFTRSCRNSRSPGRGFNPDPSKSTTRRSGRACRRRGQSRFARLHPWDEG